jgi:hypothetical protein
VPIDLTVTRPRLVDPRGERVTVARSVGTIFGDEAAV